MQNVKMITWKDVLEAGCDLTVSVEVVYVVMVKYFVRFSGELLGGHANGFIRQATRRRVQRLGNVRGIFQEVQGGVGQSRDQG